MNICCISINARERHIVETAYGEPSTSTKNAKYAKNHDNDQTGHAQPSGRYTLS